MLSVCHVLADFKQVTSADKFIYCSDSKLCHDLTEILCNELHEVHYIFRLAHKSLTKLRILRSYTHRAGILVADTHHDTSECHKRCCSKTIFLSSKHCCDCDISACHQLAIGLNDYFFTEAVSDKGLMSLSYTKLPRHSCIMD